MVPTSFEDEGMTEVNEVVSEYWAKDRSGIRPHSWLEHPTMLSFLRRRVSGDPNLSTAAWFKQQFFLEPVELGLSLGCGFGGFERAAIDLGIAKQFHANDLSKGAIEKAQIAAREAGLKKKIKYRVGNLDECSLPAGAYDAIFAMSSAHHVFHLENLFRQCRDALKPEGLLFLDEYIGPNRFRSSPLEMEIINKLLGVLPPRYRKNLFLNDGSTIDRYVPSPVDHFEKVDPSEAIRSAEIINTLEMYFDIIKFRPYGGGILHMLFSGIMGNFDEQSDSDVALLNVLATLEETLEQVGAIETHFAVIVARPRVSFATSANHRAILDRRRRDRHVLAFFGEQLQHDPDVRELTGQVGERDRQIVAADKELHRLTAAIEDRDRRLVEADLEQRRILEKADRDLRGVIQQAVESNQQIVAADKEVRRLIAEIEDRDRRLIAAEEDRDRQLVAADQALRNMTEEIGNRKLMLVAVQERLSAIENSRTRKFLTKLRAPFGTKTRGN
jgi:2-polyprenyl-3-methyl-5-hydroxy-6-metoxy-1,4-benzoquinol methylase